MESEVKWNSMKKGNFDDSEQRTIDLFNQIKKLSQSSNHIVSEKFSLQSCGINNKSIKHQPPNSVSSQNNIPRILNTAFDTLQKNPKMLKYEFNHNKSLAGIIVHSHVDLFQQLSTEDDEICDKACDVYAAIQVVIDDLYQQASSLSVPLEIPYVKLSDKLSRKCNFGLTQQNFVSTSQIYGGSKSRRRHNRHRKHARKTHRGRNLKSKSKRHVRGRKNKKNTYTRRR